MKILTKNNYLGLIENQYLEIKCPNLGPGKNVMALKMTSKAQMTTDIFSCHQKYDISILKIEKQNQTNKNKQTNKQKTKTKIKETYILHHLIVGTMKMNYYSRVFNISYFFIFH